MTPVYHLEILGCIDFNTKLWMLHTLKNEKNIYISTVYWTILSPFISHLQEYNLRSVWKHHSVSCSYCTVRANQKQLPLSELNMAWWFHTTSALDHERIWSIKQSYLCFIWNLLALAKLYFWLRNTLCTLYPLVYIEVMLLVKGQNKPLSVCEHCRGIICSKMMQHLIFSIWILAVFLWVCDVKYSLTSSVELRAAQLNASEEASRWWAWTKWLSYCNSRQGWDAWIQSATWKAGKLRVSHSTHIKEQTGEWHRAVFWSSRSPERKRVVDSIPSIASAPHPTHSPASFLPSTLTHPLSLDLILSFCDLIFHLINSRFFFPPRHSWLRFLGH